jgi:hypothetical protein
MIEYKDYVPPKETSVVIDGKLVPCDEGAIAALARNAMELSRQREDEEE